MKIDKQIDKDKTEETGKRKTKTTKKCVAEQMQKYKKIGAFWKE